MPRKKAILLILAVVLLGLSVRVNQLNSEQPWIDEIQSIDTATSSVDILLSKTAFGDVHPPLYYLLLKSSQVLWGTSLFGLRLLSLLFGLLTIAIIAWPRSKEPFERNLRLSCAGVLCLHAGHIHFSQEIRSYSLLCLLLLLQLLCLRRLLREPSVKRALVAGLCMALCLWTHHVSWLYLFGMYVGLLLFHQMTFAQRRWLGLSFASGIALAAPWIPYLVHQNVGLPGAFQGHLDGLPGLNDFARVFGPWGGMVSPPSVFLGLLVFVAIPASTIGRQMGFKPRQSRHVDEPGPRWGLALALTGFLLSLALVPFVPRPSLADQAFMDLLPRSIALAFSLPLLAFYFPAWLGRFWNRGGMMSTHAMVTGSLVILALGIGLGRLGQARLLLPFAVLLLEASCVDATKANLELIRRLRILPLTLVLIFPALPSSWGQSKYVAPRPDTQGILNYAQQSGRNTIYVHPCYDVPVFDYAKAHSKQQYASMEIQNRCMYDADGRLSLSPPSVRPDAGVVVFLRKKCAKVTEEFEAHPALKAANADIAELIPFKGACVAVLKAGD